MSRIGPDSPFYSALSLATDIIIVNVLMVITSLPVVTAGTSLRAGNAVIYALMLGEGSKPARMYFSDWRKHWRLSTIWWLGVVVLVLIGAYEVALLNQSDFGDVDLILRGGLIVGLLLVAVLSAWLYLGEGLRPLPWKQSIARAGFLSAKYLIPTFVAVVIVLVPIVVVLLAPQSLLTVLGFYALIGVSLSIYLFQLSARRAVDESILGVASESDS